MDALTRLIQLSRPQASLELRCLLAGGYAIDHTQEPAGNAPFHLVLAGECVIETVPRRGLKLRAGDFVLFPRGGAHRVRNAGAALPARPVRLSHDGMLPLRRNGRGAAELDLLCGRFVYAPGPAALLLQTLPDPLHVSLAGSSSAPALQALVTLMRDEAALRAPGALAIVTALSQALLAMALRSHGQGAGRSAAPGVPALLADARLAASLQAMLAEPGRAWTIADLGHLAAMSRATYARQFRQVAGMTVGDFLTRLRLSIAADLLLSTRRGAADIGEQVGYQSEAAFGKAFKKAMGLTPGRYRRAQASASAMRALAE